MLIVAKIGDKLSLYKSLDELRGVLGSKIVVVTVLDAEAHEVERKCGAVENCLAERLILYTNEPGFIKSSGVEVEEVFDLGGEYAVAVRGPPERVLALVADKRVTRAERVGVMRAL